MDMKDMHERIEALEFSLIRSMAALGALEQALAEESFGQRVLARCADLRPQMIERAEKILAESRIPSSPEIQG